MRKLFPAMCTGILGTILLAGCSPPPGTYAVWLVAAPGSVSSPTPSAIKATVTSSTEPFSGIVTFAVSGCGTITPASATVTDGTATATFTPNVDSVAENCNATITSVASNGRSWPFKAIFATGTGTVSVLPPPVTSAPVPVSLNSPGSAPSTVVVKPSVTAQTWAYTVSLNPISSANDRIAMINITLNIACPKPTSTAFAPTITPASATSTTWKLEYPGSGILTDDITFAKCAGKAGGTAQFDVRVNTAENDVPLISVTGPK